MGERTEEVKVRLLKIFPELAHDENFKITSKESSDYNCIAWAYIIEDKWMWPNTGDGSFLDGVNYWPSDEIFDMAFGQVSWGDMLIFNMDHLTR